MKRIWLVLALIACGAGRAFGSEAISIEEPPPESVEGEKTSIGETFAEAPEPERISDRLKDLLKDSPAFLRDSTLSLKLRTYYLRRDQFDDSTSEAWTAGGALHYETGRLFDRLSFGATGYTSLPLYGPDDTGGTLLLDDEEHGYGVVGELYGKLELAEGVAATVYRHELNTPFINTHDNRMTPNTFEAYDVIGNAKLAGDGELRYGLAWVAKIKERNSDHFVPMSEDAGAPVRRGVAVAGANMKIGGSSLGAVYYYSPDVLSIAYGEAKYARGFASGVGLLGAVQLTDQRSNGDDALTGDDFAGNQLGVKLEASYAGAIGTLAWTHTTDQTNMRNPWSSYPGYTACQVFDFNRAGEQALMGKVSLNFARMRMPGVTAYVLWTHGWDVESSAGQNQDEYDLDVQWRPSFPSWKGLWFRGRVGLVNQRGGNHDTLGDYRLIVNYDFAAL